MKFGSAILIIFLVFLVAIYSGDQATASAEDVQSVVTMAEGSKEASSLVITSLKKNPTPSVSDLRNMKKEINNVLVREVAEKTVGKDLAQPAAVPASDSIRTDGKWFRILIGSFFVIMFGAIVAYIIGYSRSQT